MRAFDLLAKAEQDIRTASHPRYHFEMAAAAVDAPAQARAADGSARGGGGARRRSATRTDKQQARTDKSARRQASHRQTSNKLAPTSDTIAPTRNIVAPTSGKLAPTERQACTADSAPSHRAPAGGLKDQVSRRDPGPTRTRYTASPSLRRSGSTSPDRITFTFASNQNVARCSSIRTTSGSRASRSV